MRLLPLICGGIMLAFARGLPAAEPVALRLLNGSNVTADGLEFTPDAVQVAGMPKLRWILDELLQLKLRSVSRPAAENVSVLETVAGDRWLVRLLRTENESLMVHWPGQPAWGMVAIPLEQIRTVILSLPASIEVRERLQRSLAGVTEKVDLLWLDNQDRLQGEFVGYDPAFIEWKSGGRLEKLAPGRCRAIRFNPDLLASSPRDKPRWRLTLADGSWVVAKRVVSLPGERLQVETACGPRLELPLVALAEARRESNGVVLLSELTPTKVEFTPYFTQQRQLVIDRNGLQGPLEIRGRAFPLGLGCYSRMHVEYELTGTETAFQSTVGIDDAARGVGSVLFAVEVDGARVWVSPKVTGRDPPLETPRIPLKKAKRLTLIVEFGDLADVGDLANWCDPCLFRSQ